MTLGTKFGHNSTTLRCKKEKSHSFTSSSSFQRFLSERQDCCCCQHSFAAWATRHVCCLDRNYVPL